MLLVEVDYNQNIIYKEEEEKNKRLHYLDNSFSDLTFIETSFYVCPRRFQMIKKTSVLSLPFKKK